MARRGNVDAPAVDGGSGAAGKADQEAEDPASLFFRSKACRAPYFPCICCGGRGVLNRVVVFFFLKTLF